MENYADLGLILYNNKVVLDQPYSPTKLYLLQFLTILMFFFCFFHPYILYLYDFPGGGYIPYALPSDGRELLLNDMVRLLELQFCC